MTREEFYNNSPIGHTRKGSRELDFGVDWRGLSKWPRYRVTWVVGTGEVIAVSPAQDGKLEHQVYEILGHVETEEELDERLKDWVDHIWEDNSLDWVRKRVELSEDKNNE